MKFLKYMRFTACALAFFAQPLLAEKSSIDGVKLMTLNVAHARATGMFQMLQSTVQAEAHLHDIVRLIRREQPDIVAFQEIDKNAFWTGRVDQMQLIAEKSEYIHWFTGSHQSGGFLNYGTGLMSKHPLSNPISITFRKPFARLRKGFVLSVVDWPEIENTKVDVISVHLDFLSTSERRQEMNTLQNLLAGRQNLRIVMGDFNTEFDHDAGLIRNLTNELGLRAWKPQSKELVTFPKLDKRIDWVLVSDEFTFLRHRILPDPVSDHNAVIVTVTLLNSALARAAARRALRDGPSGNSPQCTTPPPRNSRARALARWTSAHDSPGFSERSHQTDLCTHENSYTKSR